MCSSTSLFDSNRDVRQNGVNARENITKTQHSLPFSLEQCRDSSERRSKDDPYRAAGPSASTWRTKAHRFVSWFSSGSCAGLITDGRNTSARIVAVVDLRRCRSVLRVRSENERMSERCDEYVVPWWLTCNCSVEVDYKSRRSYINDDFTNLVLDGRADL